MANGIGQVHVRMQHGKVTVQGMGQTPRGQRYLKSNIPLEAPRLGSKKFKTQLAVAVKEMLAQQELDF